MTRLFRLGVRYVPPIDIEIRGHLHVYGATSVRFQTKMRKMMRHWIPGHFRFRLPKKKFIRNFFISSFRLLQKYWRVGHPATKQ